MTERARFYRGGLIAAALIAFALTACTPQSEPSQQTLPSAQPHGIQAHLEFLADDLLEGRDTGSRGHEIASKYIASQFQLLGLEPAGTDGYFQRITFRSSRLQPEQHPQMNLIINGETQALSYPSQFTSGPSATHTDIDITAELVFAGYGLVSDTFGIDDYAGLNVDGKIVVIVQGRPDFLPSEEAAHLNAQKTANAVERGAVGLITLHTPAREKVRPWRSSMIFVNAPRIRWLDPDGQPHNDFGQLQGSASLHFEAAAPLFENAEQSLEDVFAQMEAGEMPRGFPLPAQAHIKKSSVFDEITSPNVIAVLEGSDPELKHEYVLYTAHSDHTGLARDFSSTSNINNGALDNAAGVAVMLETARIYAQLAEQGQRPKRSIMFAAVTAEERGLLGADYFANYPTVPLESIVANVNLDMPVLLYPFADIVAFGAEHSSLGAVAARAAGRHDTALTPDPMPEQAIFTRSDHYTLVRQGIPAVFLMTGFTSRNEDEDGGEIWARFFAENYHRPGDDIPTLTEMYGGIRYDYGAIFTDINVEIGLDIANEAKRPYWLPDSYFGHIFGQDSNGVRH
ncbi:M28 family peptidase [Aliidiomarina halalkaliphila]|uniref:M28 family peptidase n=1 Tax=Aliidiomarina halalkaliphila TaxID=2593535 RepID=A0A552X2Z0_9GAMM|nr:M28 family metallopeptidase [Aliidiomarina halalkaliphila]TRW49326.1 M28 family peptidase [Aliidiomarina halalkaliphila]